MRYRFHMQKDAVLRTALQARLPVKKARHFPELSGTGKTVISWCPLVVRLPKSRLAPDRVPARLGCGRGAFGEVSVSVWPRHERLPSMRSPNVRLRIEELGARILPRAAPVPSGLAAGATHHADVTPPPAAARVNLHGTVQGTLVPVIRGPIDAGLQYDLTGAGVLGGQPPFLASGTLHRTGMIAPGHATGTLTLTNARGSITLRLEGPPQPGFAPLPGGFHFVVTGGTGAYWGVTGDGQLTLQTRPLGGLVPFKLAFA
jgi:hypothetical protein